MNSGLDFIIIGAHKGGSTYLARAVAAHPDVWMPDEEVPVFRDPVHTPSNVEQLKAALAVHSDVTYRGIKCPDYLASPEVPARLAALVQPPKIVACLRNPVERAISNYFWDVRWGMLPLEEPSVGLKKVLDGDYRALTPAVDGILNWGRYAEHLDRYAEFFAADRVHVLLNDDLRRNPNQALKVLFDFLGVESSFRPSVRESHANEGVYPAKRLRFLNLRNRYILSWDEERRYVHLARARGVWPRTASMAVAGIDRYLLSRIYGNAKPTLTDEVQDQLRAYYRPDVLRLEQLLSRDLSAWR